MSEVESKAFHQITRRIFRQLQTIDRKLIRLGAALARPEAPVASPPREYCDLTWAALASLLPGPKTKREIRAELHAQGFAFGGPPLKVLDLVLYTKRFRRAGRLFWRA